jgi:hypothetical protein
MACLVAGSPFPLFSSRREDEDGLSLRELMEVTSEGDMPRFGALAPAEYEGPKGLVILSGVGRLNSFVLVDKETKSLQRGKRTQRRMLTDAVHGVA